MNVKDRLDALEKKMFRMEGILWYLFIATSIKGASELLPVVTALVK